MIRRKAQELVNKIREECHQAKTDVARISGEKQAVMKKAAELKNNINIEIGEKPTIVDVYQHSRYEKTEPFISQIYIDDHEDKSLGFKIIESVKDLL